MRVLLVLACLLAFATSAHAECAWVLWSDLRVAGEEMSPLKTLEAFSTHGECEEAQKARINETASDLLRPALTFIQLKVEKLKHGVRVTGHEKATGNPTAPELYRYLCLPDTIDPRGPKGK